MKLRIRRPFFAAPICDEVALSRRARNYIADLEKPLSPEQVLKIAKKESVELATRCLYESLLLSDHGRFIEEIAQQPTTPIPIDGRIKLYIVPGMFYRGHPEIGTDGSLVGEVAARFGFDVHAVDSRGTGSIAVNAERLKADLERENAARVWLVSISRGACEVRKYLQENVKPAALEGWVNISGIHKGVPFVDGKFSTPARRLFAALLCRVFGVDFEALREMRTDQALWQNRQWPQDLEVVNLVPMPIRSHVHKAILHRYEETLALGPNDGFIPLVDALDLPGRIFPIWGCDHFMRTPELSGYLYRILNYIVARGEN